MLEKNIFKDMEIDIDNANLDESTKQKLALLKNEWVNYNLLTLKVIDSYLYYDDRIISTSPPY